MIAPPTLPAVDVAEVRNLRAYYLTSTSNVQRTVRAVDDISLRIHEGEVYGIAGESGCGKSTLLKVLLGMPSTCWLSRTLKSARCVGKWFRTSLRARCTS